LAGRIARGDIRLYTFEKPDKTRPVVVLTRDTAIEYLSRVTIAPITSSIRGVPSEIVLDESDGMKGPRAVNLHNVVTIPKDQVGKRVGQLSAERMKQLCSALRFSLGCE
jgi:mRNA interferase MazF